MKDKADPDTVFIDDQRHVASGSARRALTFDAAKYEAIIDDLDLSEDARHELLGVMWNIIVGFVDLGFEVKMAGEDSASQSCGQSSAEADASGEAVLDCPLNQAINESFFAASSAADLDSNKKEKA